MQKILSRREKVILTVTMGVVIFSLGFNLFLKPILNRNGNLNKEINLTRTNLKKYLWLLSQKEYLQNRYEKFSQTFKAQAQGEDILVSALSELENLAKASNMRILDMRPQSPKKLDLYTEALIELKIEGNMEGYLQFIYNIENSLSLLRIKKFQLNAKPNTPALEGTFSISYLSALQENRFQR